MKIKFEFTDGDRKYVKDFYEIWKKNGFVQSRLARNVDGQRAALSKEEFWMAMVSALLTTQQRSGPGSAINRFLDLEPFPIALAICDDCGDVVGLVSKAIKTAGGIRRGNRIAAALSYNIKWLKESGWDRLLDMLKDLEANHAAEKERTVARFVAQTFKEVGPKQSRNILQMLGLTRYEIPLDSRFTRWLNEAGFPIQLNAKLFSDEEFYSFVIDAVKSLCAEVDLYPCLLDAAVFVSIDGQEAWSKSVMKW